MVSYNTVASVCLVPWLQLYGKVKDVVLRSPWPQLYGKVKDVVFA